MTPQGFLGWIAFAEIAYLGAAAVLLGTWAISRASRSEWGPACAIGSACFVSVLGIAAVLLL